MSAPRRASDLYDTKREPTPDYLDLMQQFPYRPTLFLGLGGTGCQAVSKIKDLFNTIYVNAATTSDGEAAGRIPDLYAFRGFDTNQAERPVNLPNDSEWFHLPVRNLQAFYKANGKDPLYRDWLCPSLSGSAVTYGAGGFRNIGKLCLYFNMQTFGDSIAAAMTQVSTADHRNEVLRYDPIVYVFCSLAGGTGSGMVLDACLHIRAAYPNARIVGMIGVLEGLPEMDIRSRTRSHVGTYCALRELDAFMTGRTEGLPRGRFQMPYQRHGENREPFDHCFLIQSFRDDGQLTLPTQNAFSSYLARLGFMLTAYSFRAEGGTTPDFEGVLVNKAADFAMAVGGARFSYLVPGMGQLVFPIDECVDVFVMEATRNFARYLAGGTARPGNAEAKAFSDTEGLAFSRIRERLALHPETGKAVATTSYSEKVTSILSSKDRYVPANRDTVIGLGKNIPDGRLQQLQSLLKLNIPGFIQHVEAAVRKEVGRLLVNPDYLSRGAIDFVADLRLFLQDEMAALQAEDKARVDPRFSVLQAQWKQLEPEVTDVVTSDGKVDEVLDSFKLGRVREQLIAFLDSTETPILSRAQNRVTEEALSQILRLINTLHDDLERVFTTVLPKVADEAEKARNRMVTSLEMQTAGQAPDVANIQAVNVLSREWRRAYFSKSSTYNPEAVMQNLLEQGWHPVSLLAARPPKNKELVSHLAETITEAILPFAEKDRRMTPLDVIQADDQYRGRKPADVIAHKIAYLVKPQAAINSGHSILNQPPSTISFSGGVNESVLATLKETSDLGTFRFMPAESWEPGRFSFFTAYLPISLAGCDWVTDHLETQYLYWQQELVKTEGQKGAAQELRKYTCFPGSDGWTSPTTRFTQLDAMKEQFATGLAISELFKPGDKDLKSMIVTGRGPKDSRYGIFQVGRTDFWMWPFFEPYPEGGLAGTCQTDGAPVRLGSNIADAYDAFERDTALVEHARRWKEWAVSNWNEIFTAEGFRQALDNAIQAFQQRRARARGANVRQDELWNDLIRVLKDWKEQI